MSTSMTLHEFNRLFPNEEDARWWFERARWANGPECYHCGVIGKAAYMPKNKFWHCKACRKQFSVTAGTPVHRTHDLAFYTCKAGISYSATIWVRGDICRAWRRRIRRSIRVVPSAAVARGRRSGLSRLPRHSSQPIKKNFYGIAFD